MLTDETLMSRLIPLGFLIVGMSGCAQQPEIAEHVFVGGSIYTADAKRRIVSAMAVREGRVVYVGNDQGATSYVGESTRVHELSGATVLPGLHDMHIHAMAIVPRPGCDLDSVPMTLFEIAQFVGSCIEEQALPEGEWLNVTQWSFSNGNQPDEELRTIRQALDRGAPRHPVMLWGNDGHHGAANSLALAQARNQAGETVGISAESLSTDFVEFEETIGVDRHGEPNGEINETARGLIRPLGQDLFGPLAAEELPKIGELLAARGITSIMDASLPPEQLALFRPLAERGELTYRLAVALYSSPSNYVREDGSFDAVSMVEALNVVREEYRQVPQIHADFAKIFVDGVIEGNPFNDPPSLGNAATLEPYRQPRFRLDAESHELEILGYVNPDSAPCRAIRQTLDELSQIEVDAFRSEHGFFPRQCRQSRGVLEHPEGVIRDYMRELDVAGFNIHAHVIGDRALRVAVDSFEALRQTNGDTGNRHSLAHIQLVHPDDYSRVGNLGLYLGFTYAWITTDLAYDLTVIPFIDQVQSLEELYDEQSYYFQNAYPVAGLKEAGAVLVAGSDAPVDSRDPRPFVNIEQAITRAGEDGQVLNQAHAVDLFEALDAYTIHGASLFGHAEETGSLEVGKLADLAVLDRDLFELARQGRADEISETRVTMTMLEGSVVFERK